ncbi:MAG TPA: hypothetical protein VMY18_05410, partial [Acidobacteriota bacterium]|nr:hypothetical protein [Acidobacteriota bacterium]
MKDGHRLYNLLREMNNAADVETAQLQEAFALLKNLGHKERMRLFSRFEKLVWKLEIWIQMICWCGVSGSRAA